jgi:hypothetical protein
MRTKQLRAMGRNTGVANDAQDVGSLPAMISLIVWPLCARKIWDAI